MEIYVMILVNIAIFIIGLFFGSFYTLARYRIPKSIDIVKKPSFCPKCNHKLGLLEQIPVLSYLISGGKCVHCKKKIDNKTIGIIAAIVAVLVVVFIAFGSSGRAGGSTPKDAVEGWMNTIKKGNFNKMMDYIHFESPESKQAALEELKEVERTEKYKLDMAKSIVELAEVSDVKMVDDNTAKVMLKTKGIDLSKLLDSDSQRTIKVKKYNGRWYLTENPF